MAVSAKRIAVFDLGSNSFKFALFESAGRDLMKLDEAREFTSAGDEAFDIGRVSEAKIGECVEALERLSERAGRVDRRAAAATAALRRADNGAELADRFAKVLDCKVDILSGDDEARLLARGVLGEAGCNAPAAVLDIGGGSVELIRAKTDKNMVVESFDLGPIDLRRRFGPDSDDAPFSEESLQRIRSIADRTLNHLQPLTEKDRLFASGGGFTTLGDMLWRKGNRPNRVLRLQQIQDALEAMKQLSAHKLSSQYNLPLRRARILPAGAVVALAAFDRLQIEKVAISWAGLREGLAWENI